MDGMGQLLYAIRTNEQNRAAAKPGRHTTLPFTKFTKIPMDITHRLILCLNMLRFQHMYPQPLYCLWTMEDLSRLFLQLRRGIRADVGPILSLLVSTK